jgi:hypothetical protein
MSAIIALFLAALSAQPGKDGPVEGQPPQPPQLLIALGINEKGDLLIRDYTGPVFRQPTVPPQPGDTGPGPFFTPTSKAISLKGVKVFTAEGKELGVAALRDRLKKEEAVFAMGDGRRPEPVYTAAMRPGCLVLVFPEKVPQVGAQK